MSAKYDYSALSVWAERAFPHLDMTVILAECKCGKRFTAVSHTEHSAVTIVRTKFRNHIKRGTKTICPDGEPE